MGKAGGGLRSIIAYTHNGHNRCDLQLSMTSHTCFSSESLE